MILERSKKEIVSLAAIAVLFFVSIALVESFALETNTDRPGMDYNNFDLASANPSLCEQACNADPDCRAFTYVKPGVQGANPRCWLKNGVPAANPSDCCDSGVKGSTAVGSTMNQQLGSQIDAGYANPKTAPGFQLAQSLDLTGAYMGKPDGVYYIRQIGSSIYMYGEEKSQSYPPFWSNIAYGTVSGNTINLAWVDMPKGSTQNSGTLTLSITQPGGMTVLTVNQQTGGFSTTQMIRMVDGTAFLPP
jgi:hypothetical protein